jgi:hypothetical protein
MLIAQRASGSSPLADATLILLSAKMPTLLRIVLTEAGDFKGGVLRMHKSVFVVTALFILPVQAEARPYHHIYRVEHFRQAMALVDGNERVALVPQDVRTRSADARDLSTVLATLFPS